VIKCSFDIGGTLLWLYGPRGLLKPTEEPAWPLLDSISDIQDVARGTGSGGLTDSEVSSMTLKLDNAQHSAYAIIGIPLRVPCTVYFDDDEIFSGIVATVNLGIAMELGIES
jgi:hypothetical protein